MITIIANHNGICTKCGGAIVQGERMGFERNTVKRWCCSCLNKANAAESFRKQEQHLKRYGLL